MYLQNQSTAGSIVITACRLLQMFEVIAVIVNTVK